MNILQILLFVPFFSQSEMSNYFNPLLKVSYTQKVNFQAPEFSKGILNVHPVGFLVTFCSVIIMKCPETFKT